VDEEKKTDGPEIPGVDVNFLRFLLIFGGKNGVFLKNQCYDQFFSKFGFVLSKKTPIFSLNFSAKIF
jgi:hypothetical protein